ncbi:MAG: DUF3164 family protein [Candidatus Methylacidiphilales bacterium]
MTTEPKVKLADLSAEEKAALMAELEAQNTNKKQERKKYKELQSEIVTEIVTQLQANADKMKADKTKAFNDLATLAVSKGEVFDVKDTQKTHTFTTLDGNSRILMGVREVNSWDGTEESGVAKIKEYLHGLATDAKAARLVDMVNGMLKTDKNGSLDPRIIMELAKMADDAGSDLFTDGINIIQQAYRLTGTTVFLEASVKDKLGKWRNINKDFSEIDVDSSWLFQLPSEG